MADIILGVETEFDAALDRDHSLYTSTYTIYHASPKGVGHGKVHKKHGLLVKGVDEAGEGFIQVHYDGTATNSDHDNDGWELVGEPASIEANKAQWSKLYQSQVMAALQINKGCGMHVHVSGDDVTTDVMKRVTYFINEEANAEFITYIAGRYDNAYCKINRDYTDELLDVLFHSENCAKDGRAKRKIDVGEAPSTSNGPWCCVNMKAFRQAWVSHKYVRGAISHTPQKNTGDFEFRLFATPPSIARFLSNLDFVHALIKYCLESDNVTFNEFCLWLQSKRERRGKYRHLFQWLREGSYVEGLIPRMNG